LTDSISFEPEPSSQRPPMNCCRRAVLAEALELFPFVKVAMVAS
jgi:hypothetical protein